MAKSNLSMCIQHHALYCTINSKKRLEWRDFTLMPGHIFGYAPELHKKGCSGLFVFHKIEDDSIVVYTARRTADKYIWHKSSISKDLPVSIAIMGMLNVRIGGLDTLKYDTYGLENPETVTDYAGFTKMPNMRIPMGSFKKTLVRKSASHDFNFSSCGEFYEKYNRMGYNCAIKDAEIRQHIEKRNRQGA